MKKNLPPVPPDQTLKKMETVFSEKLKNVSVKKFYDLCIAETLDPFYGPFLEKEGNKDLNIGDWETAENELTNGWCGEKYAKKRVIKYNFTRTSHLYIGPPIASVTETQYCRIEGNDKCVLGTNVAMQGIPYADTFNVEVRLVARRNGSKDLSVDIGLFVDFKKSTLLKSKIRSGTIDETTSLKLKLFRAMKEVCYEGEKDIDESDDNETDEHVEDEILPPLNKINASNGKGLDMELIQKYLKVIASNLPSMEQVRSFMMSLDHTSIFVCFLLVLVAYLWTASQKSNTLTNEITLRKSDLINIEGKMDEFIVEMRETRKALQEIVLIMKEREPQAL